MPHISDNNVGGGGYNNYISHDTPSLPFNNNPGYRNSSKFGRSIVNNPEPRHHQNPNSFVVEGDNDMNYLDSSISKYYNADNVQGDTSMVRPLNNINSYKPTKQQPPWYYFKEGTLVRQNHIPSKDRISNFDILRNGVNIGGSPRPRRQQNTTFYNNGVCDDRSPKENGQFKSTNTFNSKVFDNNHLRFLKKDVEKRDGIHGTNGNTFFQSSLRSRSLSPRKALEEDYFMGKTQLPMTNVNNNVQNSGIHNPNSISTYNNHNDRSQARHYCGTRDPQHRHMPYQLSPPRNIEPHQVESINNCDIYAIPSRDLKPITRSHEPLGYSYSSRNIPTSTITNHNYYKIIKPLVRRMSFTNEQPTSYNHIQPRDKNVSVYPRGSDYGSYQTRNSYPYPQTNRYKERNYQDFPENLNTLLAINGVDEYRGRGNRNNIYTSKYYPFSLGPKYVNAGEFPFQSDHYSSLSSPSSSSNIQRNGEVVQIPIKYVNSSSKFSNAFAIPFKRTFNKLLGDRVLSNSSLASLSSVNSNLRGDHVGLVGYSPRRNASYIVTPKRQISPTRNCSIIYPKKLYSYCSNPTSTNHTVPPTLPRNSSFSSGMRGGITSPPYNPLPPDSYKLYSKSFGNYQVPITTLEGFAARDNRINSYSATAFDKPLVNDSKYFKNNDSTNTTSKDDEFASILTKIRSLCNYSSNNNTTPTKDPVSLPTSSLNNLTNTINSIPSNSILDNKLTLEKIIPNFISPKPSNQTLSNTSTQTFNVEDHYPKPTSANESFINTKIIDRAILPDYSRGPNKVESINFLLSKPKSELKKRDFRPPRIRSPFSVVDRVQKLENLIKSSNPSPSLISNSDLNVEKPLLHLSVPPAPQVYSDRNLEIKNNFVNGNKFRNEPLFDTCKSDIINDPIRRSSSFVYLSPLSPTNTLKEWDLINTRLPSPDSTIDRNNYKKGILKNKSPASSNGVDVVAMNLDTPTLVASSSPQNYILNERGMIGHDFVPLKAYSEPGQTSPQAIGQPTSLSNSAINNYASNQQNDSMNQPPTTINPDKKAVKRAKSVRFSNTVKEQLIPSVQSPTNSYSDHENDPATHINDNNYNHENPGSQFQINSFLPKPFDYDASLINSSYSDLNGGPCVIPRPKIVSLGTNGGSTLYH